MVAPLKKPRKNGIDLSDERRRQVKSMSAVGTRVEDIARVFDCSLSAIKKHFRQEIATGRIEANARVAQSLYQLAIKGNVTACIFWMKTRGGWREQPSGEMLIGKDGQSLQPVIYMPANGRDGGTT